MHLIAHEVRNTGMRRHRDGWTVPPWVTSSKVQYEQSLNAFVRRWRVNFSLLGRFLPFKVPLDQRYDTKVPVANRFGLEDVFTVARNAKVRSCGWLIDQLVGCLCVRGCLIDWLTLFCSHGLFGFLDVFSNFLLFCESFYAWFNVSRRLFRRLVRKKVGSISFNGRLAWLIDWLARSSLDWLINSIWSAWFVPVFCACVSLFLVLYDKIYRWLSRFNFDPSQI